MLTICGADADDEYVETGGAMDEPVAMNTKNNSALDLHNCHQ
jgi:hypothetical protein